MRNICSMQLTDFHMIQIYLIMLIQHSNVFEWTRYRIHFVWQPMLSIMNQFNKIRLGLYVFNATFNNNLAIRRMSDFFDGITPEYTEKFTDHLQTTNFIIYCCFEYTGNLPQNFSGDTFCKYRFEMYLSYIWSQATTLPTIIYHIK